MTGGLGTRDIGTRDIGTRDIGTSGLGGEAIGAEENSAAVEGSWPSPESRVPSPGCSVPSPQSLPRRRFVASAIAAPFVLRFGVRRLAADHVVVVGAGAFGGWTALTLLRAGMRVTLVDAWGAGNSRASSGGETRVIRTVYNGNALYTQMAARAFTLWREAEQQWKRQVLFRTGALWMCETDDSYVRRSIESIKAVGLSVEEMTPSEAARRYPQMGFGDVRTTFFEPEAGYLTARTACELVRETVVREGGTYRQASVRPGTAAGGRLTRVALSDGGTLDADRFVFACGPWMGPVFSDVVGRRIVATRQEVFFFGTPGRRHALRLRNTASMGARGRATHLRHPQPRAARAQVGGRYRRTRGRPDDAATRAQRRGYRARAHVRGQAIPCPGRRTTRRDARVPVRSVDGRKLSRRSTSAARERVAAWWRVGARLQDGTCVRRARCGSDSGSSRGEPAVRVCASQATTVDASSGAIMVSLRATRQSVQPQRY